MSKGTRKICDLTGIMLIILTLTKVTWLVKALQLE